MNKTIAYYCRLGIIAAFLIFPNHAFSQNEEIADIINSGKSDAEKIFKAYMKPVNALSGGINYGWFNTALPLKPWRFNIDFKAGISYVPTSQRTFDLRALGLSDRLQLQGSNTIAPTFVGKGGHTPQVIVLDDEGDEMTSFNMPEGIDFPYIPSLAALQVNLGLPFKTELGLRLLPRININNDATISFWGIAIMHDIKQWIPIISDKLFDLSLMAGYTQLTTKLILELTPENNYKPEPGSETFDPHSEQSLIVRPKSFTVGAIISKKLSIITFYGALGYDYNRYDILMKGQYPLIVSVNEGSPAGGGYYTLVKNPLNIYDSMHNVRATGGARLKLGFLTTYIEGSWSRYPAVNAGLGLNFNI